MAAGKNNNFFLPFMHDDALIPSFVRNANCFFRETDSDAEEKRALKRALKMKEKAYQERLSKWEAREKDKARYYDKIERKEKDK